MIDVHAHAVLEGTLGCAGHYGPELGTGPEGRPRFRVGGYVLDGIDYRDTPFMDVGRRLELNDHLG
ncbi:MAG: amidohydrolase, partial [Ilumatobacteraceae bacterium]